MPGFFNQVTSNIMPPHLCFVVAILVLLQTLEFYFCRRYFSTYFTNSEGPRRLKTKNSVSSMSIYGFTDMTSN